MLPWRAQGSVDRKAYRCARGGRGTGGHGHCPGLSRQSWGRQGAGVHGDNTWDCAPRWQGQGWRATRGPRPTGTTRRRAARRRDAPSAEAVPEGGGSARRIPSRSGSAATVTGCKVLKWAFHGNADGRPLGAAGGAERAPTRACGGLPPSPACRGPLCPPSLERHPLPPLLCARSRCNAGRSAETSDFWAEGESLPGEGPTQDRREGRERAGQSAGQRQESQNLRNRARWPGTWPHDDRGYPGLLRSSSSHTTGSLPKQCGPRPLPGPGAPRESGLGLPASLGLCALASARDRGPRWGHRQADSWAFQGTSRSRQGARGPSGS